MTHSIRHLKLVTTVSTPTKRQSAYYCSVPSQHIITKRQTMYCKVILMCLWISIFEVENKQY
jgi:hypothetical protein